MDANHDLSNWTANNPHIDDTQKAWILPSIREKEKRIAQLEAENTLLKAERDGAGSLLLDVQQDCIKLRKELEFLRVEGARADDC